MDKQQYYKLYYIKNKEYILNQKKEFREAMRLYKNQLREIKVIILDKKDGNQIREYYCSGIV